MVGIRTQFHPPYSLQVEHIPKLPGPFDKRFLPRLVKVKSRSETKAQALQSARPLLRAKQRQAKDAKRGYVKRALAPAERVLKQALWPLLGQLQPPKGNGCARYNSTRPHPEDSSQPLCLKSHSGPKTLGGLLARGRPQCDHVSLDVCKPRRGIGLGASLV